MPNQNKNNQKMSPNRQPSKVDNKTNLIGLCVFVGVLVIVVIVIFIMTMSISSGTNNNSNANTNLGIHTSKTTAPVSVVTTDANAKKTTAGADGSGVMTVKEDVNVRSGPGSNYDKLGELSAGTQVTVYEINAGWLRIDFENSDSAYIYENYVDGTFTGATASGDAYTTTTTTAAQGYYDNEGNWVQNNNQTTTTGYYDDNGNWVTGTTTTTAVTYVQY